MDTYRKKFFIIKQCLEVHYTAVNAHVDAHGKSGQKIQNNYQNFV